MGSWVTPNAEINPQYFVQDPYVPQQKYNDKLYETSVKTWNELIGEDNSNADYCHFEVRTALDCVIRNKTRKDSIYEDTVSKCDHHFKFMSKAMASKFGLNEKQLYSDFYSKMKTFSRAPEPFI